jgi:hypothetical protein
MLPVILGLVLMTASSCTCSTSSGPPPQLADADVRSLATEYRDAWIQQNRPEGSELLKAGVVQTIEQSSDGWHVTFVTRTGHDKPDGVHDYFLHVYIARDGKLQRVVRGPDLLS